jgi:hypothetical protein
VVAQTNSAGLSMKIKTALLILTFGAMPISFEVGAGDIFKYSDVVNPKNNFSIDAKHGRVLVGDVVEEAVFCSDNDRYICFESKALSFHVPKVLGPASRRWKSASTLEYEVEQGSDYMLFGSAEKIYRIVEGDSEKKTIYLYSQKSGLVGFIFFFEIERKSRVFLLNKPCGFGAASYCSKRP